MPNLVITRVTYADPCHCEARSAEAFSRLTIVPRLVRREITSALCRIAMTVAATNDVAAATTKDLDPHAAHAPAVPADQLPLGHRPQPHRRVANVPVQRQRRIGRRLAHPASRRPRHGRRGDRVHRGDARIRRRPHHASLPRAMEHTAPGAAAPDRDNRRARWRSAGRTTRSCRPQGVGAAPVGGRRADRTAGRRLGAAGAERDPNGRRRH